MANLSFEVISRRPTLSGQDMPAGSYSAETRAVSSREPWSDDREFAAYIFLILFIGMPCIFLGTFYLLFAN